MATTTNYGWTTPDDTSLVKDGASAIRTLGSAIDTSLNTALGTKKAGLVLLNTTTFSAVSSQSAPASTFSATYANYRIVFNLTGSVNVANELRLRVRTGSTDLTTSYSGALKFMANATTTSFDNATSPTDRFNIGYATNGATNRVTGAIDICNPFASLPTAISGILTGVIVGSYNGFGLTGGFVENTTSYDSFTIYPASGTITGTIQVFGYNQ